MKSILSARIIQGFRNRRPVYDRIKGHTGVDLDFVNEAIFSPLTCSFVAYVRQKEMGNTLYLRHDASGAILVFAHLSFTIVAAGDKVDRGESIGKSGNTGTITTGPHLHFEIVCPQPYRPEDKVMTRTLPAARGFNTDPIPFIRDQLRKYNVPTP